jgi:hypothetical protein
VASVGTICAVAASISIASSGVNVSNFVAWAAWRLAARMSLRVAVSQTPAAAEPASAMNCLRENSDMCRGLRPMKPSSGF